MRREGKQHGVVRSFTVFSTKNKVINKFDSLPAAGIFQKVSSKPTNHSKFTGVCRHPRCYECHALPVSKSKEKAKGSHKLKSNDVATNQKLLAWRVVDRNKGLNYTGLSGLSATAVLDCLLGDDLDEDDRDEEHMEEEEEEEEEDLAEVRSELALNIGNAKLSVVIDVDHGAGDEMIDDKYKLKVGDCDLDDDDDDSDYDLVLCHVEVDCESVEEEGWCLIKEDFC